MGFLEVQPLLCTLAPAVRGPATLSGLLLTARGVVLQGLQEEVQLIEWPSPLQARLFLLCLSSVLSVKCACIACFV